MTTARYVSHRFINKATGMEIQCRREVEALHNMVTAQQNEIMHDGKKVTIFSDKIETVEKGKKLERTRVTVVEVE